MNATHPSSLIDIADRVNTGLGTPETSRALVVFNLTEQPITGVAVFRASMSWPMHQPLPPVVVADMNDSSVRSAIQDRAEGADAKGRADRRQLSFALYFAVTDIPAAGWRTYIAAYADTPSPSLQHFVETPGLVVVETLRHGGDLPPIGNF